MNFKYCFFTILLIFTIFNLSNSTFTPVECDLCQLSVDSLSNVAKTDNLTYAQVDDALQRICNSIPSNYSGICNYVLEAMGPKVIQQILNGTKSSIVCTELTICNSVNIVKNAADNNSFCYFGREIINFFNEAMLIENQLPEIIKTTLNTFEKLILSTFGDIDEICNSK